MPGRYGRSDVIANQVADANTIRLARGIYSPANPSG